MTEPIELRYMTHDERDEICRTSEHYFMRGRVIRKLNPAFRTLRKDITHYLKSKGEKLLSSDSELWNIIGGVAKARKYNTNKLFFSFDNNAYTKNKKMTGHALSYTKTMRIVDVLAELGYVTKYVGFYLRDDLKCQSILECSPEFLNMFDKDICKKYATERDRSLVELKSDGVLRNWKYGTIGLKEKKALLAKYNMLIEETEVTIDGKEWTNIVYKIVHEDDMDGHGRIYALGTFQTCKSEKRKTITIDGEECCELDFTATHPNILYQLSGAKPPKGDMYCIKGMDKYGSDEERRNFVKLLTMCVLFGKSRIKAVAAIRRKIGQDKYSENPSFPSFHQYHKGKDLNKMVDLFIAHHKAISKFFFVSKLWSFLQNKDSRIAMYVIEHFVDRGIAILSYHDSFVVQKKYIELLEKVMKEAWKFVLGGDSRCFIDAKFGKDVDIESNVGVLRGLAVRPNTVASTDMQPITKNNLYKDLLRLADRLARLGVTNIKKYMDDNFEWLSRRPPSSINQTLCVNMC